MTIDLRLLSGFGLLAVAALDLKLQLHNMRTTGFWITHTSDEEGFICDQIADMKQP
jgi:hypothetical protein